MGMSCEYPPPAAPPLMPNTGPSDGSRRASIVSMLMAFMLSERPTAVTVLPSPSGVGVMAVTSMILPSGLSLRRSSRAM